jgi:hydroxypyruvate reductase
LGKTDTALVLAPIPADALSAARDRLELITAPDPPLSFLQTYAGRDDIEIVFTIGNRPLTRAMIELLPALRYVCHFGVGTDQIDLDTLRERGVLVTNTAGASASCVADLAVGLLLSVVRQLPQSDAFVRAGGWQERSLPYGPSLGGRKVGIYGLGQIGSKVAARLVPFETEIGYHARAQRDALPYRYFATLAELADWADDLIVTVSATPQTVGAVDGPVLEALGPGGTLVNVARGSIVDEPALVAALTSGALGGAGLDTFANEPDIDPAFLTINNVVLSPHVGGGTQRAIAKATEIFLANLDRYLSGQSPQNIVD